MSAYTRAYVHGTIMVLAGFGVAFLAVLIHQYEIARMFVPVAPFLGAMVAALVAPMRRFLVGISLLPIIGAALFVLVVAWNLTVPMLRTEGIAEAMHEVLGMSPIWTGACIIGAAVGWAVKLRRATPPNTSLERTRGR